MSANEITKGGRRGEHSGRPDDPVPPSPTLDGPEAREDQATPADVQRYGVDVSENGCATCGLGRQLAVVDRFDPAGVTELLGMTFEADDEGGIDTAEAIAEALNDAYSAGHASGRQGLSREATESHVELLRRHEALVKALREIRSLERAPFDFPKDWEAQIKACAECERYKHHPIQLGICDEHRRPLYAREKWNDDEERRLGYRAMEISRAALALADPAPTVDTTATRVGDDPSFRRGRSSSWVWSKRETRRRMAWRKAKRWLAEWGVLALAALVLLTTGALLATLLLGLPGARWLQMAGGLLLGGCWLAGFGIYVGTTGNR